MQIKNKLSNKNWLLSIWEEMKVTVKNDNIGKEKVHKKYIKKT